MLSIPRAGIYFKDNELDKSKYDPKKAENLMEREILSAKLQDRNLSDEDRSKVVAQINEL